MVPMNFTHFFYTHTVPAPQLKGHFTANVGTEGAVKKFLIWDVSEEFPIIQSVLNGMT
jgi:hypothetical protein